MNTYYLNKYKVDKFLGYCFFNDNDENSYISIDFRVMQLSQFKAKMKELNKEVTLISSEKLPVIYSLVTFTNGKNNKIGSIDLRAGSYQVRGGGGGFSDNTPVCQQLAHVFGRTVSEEQKIYKLEGFTITKNFGIE